VPTPQGRAYGRDEITDLLRTALGELLADGTSFRELSVERLCAQAGIARSTFYLHFEDKFAMLQALSAATLLRLYSAQRVWIGAGAEVTLQDVRRGMRELFELFHADEAVLRAVAEASVYSPAIRVSYHDAVLDYARAIERFIRKGQSGGWVKDVQPAHTAVALAWMTERTVSQVGSDPSRRRRSSTADALAQVFCSTLLSD
jgi:AcrR family transcriptional regulator